METHCDINKIGKILRCGGYNFNQASHVWLARIAASANMSDVLISKTQAHALLRSRRGNEADILETALKVWPN